MKEYLMLDTINRLDDDLLEQHFQTKERLLARKARKQATRRPSWARWAAVAASVMLVCGCALGVLLYQRITPPPTVEPGNNAGTTTPGTTDTTPNTPGVTSPTRVDNGQEKPDMEQVVWLSYPSGGVGATGSNNSEPEDYIIGGKKVTKALYKTISSAEDHPFALVVCKDPIPGVDADLEYLTSLNQEVFDYCTQIGVYAELAHEYVYIFITQQEFIDLKLTEEQYENWLFAVPSQVYYEYGPAWFEVNRVQPNELSDWEGIDFKRVGMYYGDISVDVRKPFQSVEELKEAYDYFCTHYGLEPDQYVYLTIVVRSDTSMDVKGSVEEIIECKTIYYSNYDPFIQARVKLSDFTVEKLKALANDERFSIVYICQDPLPV